MTELLLAAGFNRPRAFLVGHPNGLPKSQTVALQESSRTREVRLFLVLQSRPERGHPASRGHYHGRGWQISLLELR